MISSYWTIGSKRGMNILQIILTEFSKYCRNLLAHRFESDERVSGIICCLDQDPDFCWLNNVPSSPCTPRVPFPWRNVFPIVVLYTHGTAHYAKFVSILYPILSHYILKYSSGSCISCIPLSYHYSQIKYPMLYNIIEHHCIMISHIIQLNIPCYIVIYNNIPVYHHFQHKITACFPLRQSGPCTHAVAGQISAASLPQKSQGVRRGAVPL